jgi:hypothetical protein
VYDLVDITQVWEFFDEVVVGWLGIWISASADREIRNVISPEICAMFRAVCPSEFSSIDCTKVNSA